MAAKTALATQVALQGSWGCVKKEQECRLSCSLLPLARKPLSLRKARKARDQQRSFTYPRRDGGKIVAVMSEAKPSVSSGKPSEEPPAVINWMQNWYPASLIEDLDPKKPTSFTILGQDLVLWCDKGGNWRAFPDLCPHRLAPLSEGRIDETGCLQCSYHGWSFDGEGHCTSIPQAKKEGPEARAKDSERAACASLPTRVFFGCLWVWPDKKTADLAARTPLPSPPEEFDDPSFATAAIQRDLYYNFDTLMENVADPSHIHYAHHKVTGRRDKGKPMPLTVEALSPAGFRGAGEAGPRDGGGITAEYVAPCMFVNRITIPRPSGPAWQITLCSFTIPMAPGRSRSILVSTRNFFQFLMPGDNWWNIMPRWLEHMTANKVYDGDMIVLQGQEKILAQLGASGKGGVTGSEYTRLTFTPTGADRLVLAFRTWLSKYGGGGPVWSSDALLSAPPPSTSLSKREMLDRRTQHTEVCSSCKKALSTFENVSKVVAAVGVALLAFSSVPSATPERVVLAVGSILCFASWAALQKLKQHLIFVDYVHADVE